ncbi:RNA polymerase sigma factor [Gangjinia marincola]|uniref:RNA polymerase sigma factor n=1 Tax=Gangjinia marincola TaxID=578463 RepID=A0ABN1MI24_9FLAO
MSLKQLIKACEKKDVKAQEQLYHLYAGKLFSVCLKYSSNYQEAQDNLQDAFIKVFNKVEQFKHKGSFEGWIKRIAINTCLQRYRNQTLFELVNEEAIAEVQEVEIGEDELDLSDLLSLIQELPDRYRMVFNLYVLDGYSHKEIADMLTITVGTSKSNLSRARLILKENIVLLQKKSEAKSIS